MKPPSPSLAQLARAEQYWREGRYRQRAVCHLFFRSVPPRSTYAIAAGLQPAADALRMPRFDVQDIQYLGSLTDAGGQLRFGEGFLNFLQRQAFQCDVDAIPEGTVCFPYQPLLRIEGPAIQCLLAEAVMLGLIGFSSLAATQAAQRARTSLDGAVEEAGLSPAYDESRAASHTLFHWTSIQQEGGDWKNTGLFADEPAIADTPVTLQARRIWAEDGKPVADILYRSDDGAPQGRYWISSQNTWLPIPQGRIENLLAPVFRNGQLARQHPPPAEARQYCLQQQARFGGGVAESYPYGLSEKLYQAWISDAALPKGYSEIP
ncbi:MAG: hypothetical protein KDC66_22225 [Phaeodactylibacter sp.]|nr:hypothetical protein [Phaeodactylibacter sp.]